MEAHRVLARHWRRAEAAWEKAEGAEAGRAGAVLAALDPACADRVETLALDEIFFGGGRPSSGSSRPA